MKRFLTILIYLLVAAFGYNSHSLIENISIYRLNTVKYDIASYINAIKLFNEDFGYYPDELSDLFTKPSDKNVIIQWPKDGYFRPSVNPHPAAPILDPWSSDYVYEIGMNNEIKIYSKKTKLKNIDAKNEQEYKLQAESILEIIYRTSLIIVFEIITLLALIILSSEFFKNKKQNVCEFDDYYPVLKDILHFSFDNDVPAPLLLHNITLDISRLFPVMRCAILLIKNAYSAISVASQDNPELTEYELNLLNYPELVQMISTGETLVIDQLDVLTDTHMLAGVKELLTEKGIKAIVVEPIVNDNRIVGALFIRTCADKKTFNPEEIELIQIIAKVLKPLLEKHHRYKDIF